MQEVNGKKLIIFDMDGTLVDSSLTIANAINYVRAKLDIPPMLNKKLLELVNDHTINPALVFYHTAKFEAKHEQWFSEYYTANHAKELVLYEGIEALLQSLKESGKKVALATNAYRRSTTESLEHLNIKEYFDAFICYDDVQQGKPHPDMLLQLLDDLNCTADQSVFIGDSKRDEEASMRAKIDYLMVDWGFSNHKSAIISVESLKEQILAYV